MPEELLQRMRDIHYPDAPSWFPPAPGWWILAVLIALAFLLIAYLLRARQRKQAPYAEAQRLLAEASVKQERGELPTREYLDLCNGLLKRLLVHVRHNKSAASATGDQWLKELDQLHGGHQFTRGPGKLLGDLRYAPAPPESVPGLKDLLIAFITRLQNAAKEKSEATQ